MTNYSETLKNIEKTILKKEEEYNVPYTYILKAIDEYIIKCKVTLKSVKQAITPLMKQFLPKEYYDNKYEEPWTEEEYEEEISWFVDKIARLYREWYNSKDLQMMGFNGDGSRNLPSVNGETGEYDLGFLDDSAWETRPFQDHEDWARKVMPELFIRTSMNSKGEEEMVMPTKRDLEYQALAKYPVMVKLNKNGLTLTHISGDVNTNSINFQAPLMARASKMEADSWRRKSKNGIADIVADRKAGKLTIPQAQGEIKKALIRQANDWADKESKNLTKEYADAGVPIETHYIEIPKSY